MSTNPPSPKRGEIWRVDFGGTIGAEIKKVRPAVVVSSDAVGKLPLRLIAPITEWKPHFAQSFWHVRLAPETMNGLEKESSVDALQLRSMSLDRFVLLLGRLRSSQMEEVAAAIAAIVEFQ